MKVGTRWKTLLTIALTLAVATFGVPAVFAGTSSGVGGEGSKASRAVAANTLVRIDPGERRITSVTAVGQTPEAVAVAGRTVWVHNWDDRTVSAIDARTNRVERTVSISGFSPSTPFIGTNSIAADASGAWVVSSGDGGGILTHVRPGLVAQEFRVPYDLQSVAVGGGAIWVGAKDLSGSVLLRVSPQTGAVLARVRLPQSAAFGETFSSAPIAFGQGAVWAVTPDGTLLKIDSATGRVTDKAKLGQGPVTSLAAGYGAVWVLLLDPAGGNRVLRVDPRTLRVTGKVPAPKLQGSGDQAGALAVGEGALWWNGGNSGTVWRVNPKSRKIDATVRVTPPLESFSDFVPFGIAAGAGGVWATVTVAP